DSTIPVDDVDPSDGPVSMHVDVFVPAEFAVTRMQAAVEAGGKIINQADAPSMWELADLDGNRVFLRSQPPSDQAFLPHGPRAYRIRPDAMIIEISASPAKISGVT